MPEEPRKQTTSLPGYTIRRIPRKNGTYSTQYIPTPYPIDLTTQSYRDEIKDFPMFQSLKTPNAQEILNSVYKNKYDLYDNHFKSIGLDPNIFNVNLNTNINKNILPDINQIYGERPIYESSFDEDVVITSNNPTEVNLNKSLGNLAPNRWNMKEVDNISKNTNKDLQNRAELYKTEVAPTIPEVGKSKTTSFTTTYRPYEGLVNLFNFGLSNLTARHNTNQQQKTFQPEQPSTSYFNQRMLRGDKTMFAKKGGEYQINNEYELSNIEIENLKKIGYELEIL